MKLDELVKKIGKAVEDSKPYWEARRVARQVRWPHSSACVWVHAIFCVSHWRLEAQVLTGAEQPGLCEQLPLKSAYFPHSLP